MNPVADFTSDNNGTIIRLPALPADGQATATGELVFGVGTRQNNALPSMANIVPVDQNGFSTTVYKGNTLTGVFDSGTNVYNFPDATIPYAGVWYTPSPALNLSAILKATSGVGTPVTVPFSVDNGLSLRANLNAAYDSLGAKFSGGFMWGSYRSSSAVACRPCSKAPRSVRRLGRSSPSDNRLQHGRRVQRRGRRREAPASFLLPLPPNPTPRYPRSRSINLMRCPSPRAA